MTTIALDIALFRAQCPEYGDFTKYPDALITAYWNNAILLADNTDYGMVMGGSRAFMINLVAAHLLSLSAAITKGRQGGFVSSSSVDKVSTTKVAPPTPDMFHWWLGQTPRGQELLALLQLSTVGGFGVGGLPEGDGFRKYAGIF